MAEAPFTNVDLLAWFSEDEREVCSECGKKACVSFPGLKAAFCPACNAVKVDGEQITLGQAISRRPASARPRVTSSAYSRSPPTGSPLARRVTRTRPRRRSAR